LAKLDSDTIVAGCGAALAGTLFWLLITAGLGLALRVAWGFLAHDLHGLPDLPYPAAFAVMLIVTVFFRPVRVEIK